MSAAAVAGGGAFAMASTSNAAQAPRTAAESTVCQGLATALGNNQRFIQGQRDNPDAQSAARIANREAVIKQIQVQQEASGCAVGESAQGSQAAQPGAGAGGAGNQGGAAGNAGAGAGQNTGNQGNQGGGQNTGNQGNQGGGQNTGNAGNQGGGAASGRQVCNGSTVTLSGEGGAPAASSNQFPAGTRLKVTNLDNQKSTTVEVTSVSGSCALLNNAAFEQVREPGKFLIRRALIEKVG
ncbi:hypothetical protein SZN_27206 [Streptomyces zinciresistens K42]|uniref:Secreted protein n=1 Tax=Streptomyces zinciresistens K42 TaxID=700597 RepID=G2GIV1_9ACTN|nr:hypothetical protein SZN_27206 [Streptomyces zinciresistens K42]